MHGSSWRAIALVAALLAAAPTLVRSEATSHGELELGGIAGTRSLLQAPPASPAPAPPAPVAAAPGEGLAALISPLTGMAFFITVLQNATANGTRLAGFGIPALLTNSSALRQNAPGGAPVPGLLDGGLVSGALDTLTNQFQSLQDGIARGRVSAEGTFCAQWLVSRLVQDMYNTLALTNPLATYSVGGGVGVYLATTVGVVPPPLGKYLDNACEKYRPQGAKDLTGFLIAAFGDNDYTRGLIQLFGPLDKYYQEQASKVKANAARGPLEGLQGLLPANWVSPAALVPGFLGGGGAPGPIANRISEAVNGTVIGDVLERATEALRP